MRTIANNARLPRDNAHELPETEPVHGVERILRPLTRRQDRPGGAAA